MLHIKRLVENATNTMNKDWREPTKRVWRRFLLKYFDVNDDGVIQWWEVVIPLLFLLLVNLGIEILANIITQYIHI